MGLFGTTARDVSISIVVSLVLIFIPACKEKEATTRREVPPPAAGSAAPAFRLKDIRGNTVSLADFKGRVVVLDFWTTWCSWCKETTRELEKLHREYRGKDVVILGVSLDSGGNALQKVKEFVREYELSYPMLMDDGSASRSYEVIRIPTTYILDREHVIMKVFPGYLPGLGGRIAEEVEKGLGGAAQ